MGFVHLDHGPWSSDAGFGAVPRINRASPFGSRPRFRPASRPPPELVRAMLPAAARGCLSRPEPVPRPPVLVALPCPSRPFGRDR